MSCFRWPPCCMILTSLARPTHFQGWACETTTKHAVLINLSISKSLNTAGSSLDRARWCNSFLTLAFRSSLRHVPLWMRFCWLEHVTINQKGLISTGKKYSTILFVEDKLKTKGLPNECKYSSLWHSNITIEWVWEKREESGVNIWKPNSIITC